MRRSTHRRLLGTTLAVVLAVAAAGCGGPEPISDRKVIVIGFDGMDPVLTQRMMDEGRMPNFVRAAEMGTFGPLGTSVPPQSPVAWSDFTTGLDSGGHGIFDFVHREPDSFIPYLSTSRLLPPTKTLEVGKYVFPLAGGGAELLRYGKPFWEVLEANGIEANVIRMPANFPVTGTASRELSGMGTPDITGTYGEFSFYTTELFAFAGQDIGGGDVYEIFVEDGVAETAIYGPDNPLLVEPSPLEIPFSIYPDPDLDLAKIVVGDEKALIAVGEWTDWIPTAFELMPTQSLPVMVRFYLRQVQPELELYMSPVNYDPYSPAIPLCHPADLGAELARATGRFYTQGMPEDTRAHQEGVFTVDDFISQAEVAGEELLNQYEWVLDNYHNGFLFYYFGNGDQVSHILWKAMDPEHPAYDPETAPAHRAIIEGIYEAYDQVVGTTLDKMGDDTTLIVMSDHGFSPWRRSFHMNSWLRDKGYLVLKDPNLRRDPGFLLNVDWSKTRAYAFGISGVSANVQGREPEGIVPPSEHKALLDELERELLATIDHATGEQAITRVYQRDDYYQDRGHEEIGPDMVIGYARGTRGSNESAGGKIPREVIVDNLAPWSGDHIMDHTTVPGVLLTSQELKLATPDLKSLAAAIIAEYGIEEAFPHRQP